jgi:hypothetical protein
MLEYLVKHIGMAPIKKKITEFIMLALKNKTKPTNCSDHCKIVSQNILGEDHFG